MSSFESVDPSLILSGESVPDVSVERAPSDFEQRYKWLADVALAVFPEVDPYSIELDDAAAFGFYQILKGGFEKQVERQLPNGLSKDQARKAGFALALMLHGDVDRVIKQFTTDKYAPKYRVVEGMGKNGRDIIVSILGNAALAGEIDDLKRALLPPPMVETELPQPRVKKWSTTPRTSRHVRETVEPVISEEGVAILSPPALELGDENRAAPKRARVTSRRAEHVTVEEGAPVVVAEVGIPELKTKERAVTRGRSGVFRGGRKKASAIVLEEDMKVLSRALEEIATGGSEMTSVDLEENVTGELDGQPVNDVDTKESAGSESDDTELTPELELIETEEQWKGRAKFEQIPQERMIELAAIIRLGVAAEKQLKGLTLEDDLDFLREQVRRSNEAVSEIVEHNLGLVWMEAISFVSRGPTPGSRDAIEEAAQNGVLGLVHAVKGFDPERGYTLSTYAKAWIKRDILRGYQSTKGTIRMPVNCYGLWTTLLTERDEREEQMAKQDEDRGEKRKGRAISLYDVADNSSITKRHGHKPEMLRAIVDMMTKPLDSLDRLVASHHSDGSDIELGDLIPDAQPTPEEQIMSSLPIIEHALGALVNKGVLSDREALKFTIYTNNRDTPIGQKSEDSTEFDEITYMWRICTKYRKIFGSDYERALEEINDIRNRLMRPDALGILSEHIGADFVGYAARRASERSDASA